MEIIIGIISLIVFSICLIIFSNWRSISLENEYKKIINKEAKEEVDRQIQKKLRN